MKFLRFPLSTFKIHVKHERSFVFSCSTCMAVPLMRISERKSKIQVKVKFKILSVWKGSIFYIATAQFAIWVCCFASTLMHLKHEMGKKKNIYLRDVFRKLTFSKLRGSPFDLLFAIIWSISPQTSTQILIVCAEILFRLNYRRFSYLMGISLLPNVFVWPCSEYL